jgi:tRNA modification GTPase
MHPDLNDTIVALSSAAGPGGRAIVRLSGPDAVRIVTKVFAAASPIKVTQRRIHEGSATLPGVAAPLPAELYVWPAPRTYTGQQLAEVHTLSCPPLIELLIAELLGAGARAARPGEFTLRAFLAGKFDLTRAEAVRGVIEAGSRAELQQALAQLAGGVTRPLQELRSDLLDLLADVEAGLDFTDEDIHFVEPAELLKRLARGMALVTLARKQMDQRSVAGRVFRVVLAGTPNVGKSSLFNVLAKRPAALVSPHAGTTRDYLVSKIDADGIPVELVDTAGREAGRNGIEADAQRLGAEAAQQADLVLWCQEAGESGLRIADCGFRIDAAPVIVVATKCDRGIAPENALATSATTGEGIDALRKRLGEEARKLAAPALAPSLSRCRHHVTACLEHLRRAHRVVLNADPPELLALELRGALDELGEMVGAVYTDDLLDRIFSRFCIGK